MRNRDILIIGAGAAGLMAAHTLAKAGKKVTVLEGRDRCGGRIHTLHNELFFKDAELGAEFIHGDLPVTFNLLNEAGIKYHFSGGEMWQYRNGTFSDEGWLMESWGPLMEKLNELQTDTGIGDFLQKEFPDDKNTELRKSVVQFVSGYDTADPRDASAFALRKEWQSEDEDTTHRVKGGYGVMIKYLHDEIKKAGGDIYLNSIVKTINWQQGSVKAVTEDGSSYEARKLIVALPLGILKADNSEKCALTFNPPMPQYAAAFTNMGFGAIIKILLEFDSRFWEDTKDPAGKGLNNMGFLLSDEVIPTWWTQMPQRSPVLTGWLGGPAAAAKKDMPDEELLVQALQSLSRIFKLSITELKDRLVAFHVMNWTKDPFTLGSYAYDTVDAAACRKLLSTPINNTIFFAGEYLYDGPAMGTVEAALSSGMETAKKVLTNS